MSTKTLNDHIQVTPGIAGGKPRIAGHRITVEDVVIWHDRLGMTADEISAEYGVSQADVHAALAYYFDHHAEIDRVMREGEAFAKNLRRRSPSKLQRKTITRKRNAARN